LEDDRFDPITIDEIPKLTVGVSLLTEFEDVESPIDWEVGIHGIEIFFTYNSNKNYFNLFIDREYSGTFLPEVAEEEEWDQKKTLQYLIQKAGVK
jgi:AMMECR1 domain-containing protein